MHTCTLHKAVSFLHTVMDHQQQPHDRNVQLLKTDTLGRGSYGVVCKAMWGQRLCAAKLMHHILFQANDVTTRRKFEQECCFLNKMQHPHIVEYLGTSHDSESGFLVLLMELCDESLTHFLERSKQPLAYHIEVDLCHDIALALVYIHSKDIIHRDLSSNNVLLLAGRAKITDFGMSKLLDANRRMTPLTLCPGTSVYMPPEALREPAVYSKKLDCFSFGVLLIQVMTCLFPDPGPPKEVVDDPRSPTGTVEMPVLEGQRRKSHIDLIDPTHTLLPTALGCLSYLEKDRPSAQDLCQKLAVIKEAPLYQLQTLQQNLQVKDQQLHDSQKLVRTLQGELQTKDQQLQDSQRQLQDSQRQIQQLTHQVEEKQQMIDYKETLLQELNQKLQSNEQVTAEFQQVLLQHEQAQKEAEPHETTTPPRPDLQEPQEKELAAEHQQLQLINRPGPLAQPQKNVIQQKTIQDMRWRKDFKGVEKIQRGSAASDSKTAYFNGSGSTRVHSYDSNTRKWSRLPDTPYTYFTLVVVQNMLTMVGGQLRSGEATDSLLSLLGEGSDKKWLNNLPAMPTKRYYTAAVSSGHSLIVAGGEDRHNRLDTVEVLDTDTQQWSIASPLTHPFSEATISICDERLYMLGGWDKTDLTHSVLSCSVPELLQSCQQRPLAGKMQTTPATQSTIWQREAATPNYCSSCATLCGQLFAVGGWETGKLSRAIYGYNVRTCSWEVMGDMPTARHMVLVAILDEEMMVVGGLVIGLFGGLRTKTDVVEILC